MGPTDRSAAPREARARVGNDADPSMSDAVFARGRRRRVLDAIHARSPAATARGSVEITPRLPSLEDS